MLYSQKNCILSSRKITRQQPSSALSTLHGKDSSLLSFSCAEICQRHCSPQPEAALSRNPFSAHMLDLNLMDFQASLIRAEQKLFTKVVLGYFCQKVLICENRTFCSSVHTHFDWKSFLGPEISGQKEYSHQNSHPVIMKTTATVFQVSIVCAAPDKCYLLSYKRLISLIKLNF